MRKNKMERVRQGVWLRGSRSSEPLWAPVPWQSGARTRERVRLPGSQAARQDSDIPKAGDVVLLEADERYVESKLWQEAPCFFFFLSRSTAAATTRLQQQPLQTVVLAAQEFSITKIVANSSPQRVGGVHDQLRPSGLQRGQWDSVLRLVPIFAG